MAARRVFGLERTEVRIRWKHPALCRRFLPSGGYTVPRSYLHAVERTYTFRDYVRRNYGMTVEKLTGDSRSVQAPVEILRPKTLFREAKATCARGRSTVTAAELMDRRLPDLDETGKETAVGYWRRSCVNYLRHRCTLYEEQLNAITFRGQQDYRRATLHLMRLTSLRYVAEHYGWLADTARRCRDRLECPRVYGVLEELLEREGDF